MLHAALIGNGAAAVTQAISGLGGIGKTALAVEYAYHYAAEYPHVFLANASSTTALASGYRDIGRVLGLPQADGEDLNAAVAAVVRWLGENTGYLLILDNADFTEEYTPGDLEPYLPQPLRGKVLITTRDNEALDRLNIPEDNVIPLGEMDKADAERFLWERVKPKKTIPSEADTQTIAELAEELGYLPLALEQAAAYIRVKKLAYSSYLTLYQNHPVHQLAKSKPNTGGYEKTVETTWTINFEAVQGENPAAADLLTLTAFLAPEAIPFEVVYAAAQGVISTIQAFFEGADAETALARYDEILAPLTRYSLAMKDTAQYSFSVHRLVQFVIRHRLGVENGQEWRNRAIDALNRAFPKVDFLNWPRCQRLILHSQTLAYEIQHGEIHSPSFIQLLNQSALYLESQGRYDEAEPLFVEVLSILRQSRPEVHPDIAISLGNLAELYRSQGRFDEAELLYLETLTIQRQSLPEGHSEIAASLSNLATLYESKGRYDIAEPLLVEALSILRQSLPDGHSDIATILNNLASLYRSTGRYRTSLKTCHCEILTVYRSS